MIDDVLKNVVAIMVEDAAEVYTAAVVNLDNLANGRVKYSNPDRVKKRCLEQIFDVETFICSEYGESLTGFDGKVVMEQFNKRAAEECRKIANGDIETCKRYKRRFKKNM